MKIKLIVSFIVGAAITALLMIYVVARILNTERDKLYQGAETVKVIVAKMNLPSGTILTEETLGMKSVFKSSLGSYVLTASEFEKIKDKQLKYPVRKFDPILSIYTDGNEKPFIDYTPNPLIKRIYINDDLEIQITIPENWEQISANEAGQEEADPESDLLRLGYFDPKTGEKEGIFLFSRVAQTESELEPGYLEEALEEDFDKIIWKNRPCYYGEIESDKSSTTEIFMVIEKDTILAFLVGHSESHAKSVTNIMDNIIF